MPPALRSAEANGRGRRRRGVGDAGLVRDAGRGLPVLGERGDRRLQVERHLVERARRRAPQRVADEEDHPREQRDGDA